MITGASTGIGLNCSKVFVQNGFRVFGSVRKETDGEKVKEELGDDFIPVIFDVTNQEDVIKGAEQVSEIIGNEGLALLINNAGIAVSGPLAVIDLDDYRKQFEVNVFGLIATTQAFLPMLGATIPCSHAAGKIINISSASGQIAFPLLSPYVGSKFAVEGISQSLRRELLIYGIDVIIVGPGPIKTPIWDKVEEPNEKILASDYGKMVSKFTRQFVKESETAMEVEVLANHIYKIFKTKNPKTRYAFMNQKISKWTIPRYFLPDRMLDGIIKKMFKL